MSKPITSETIADLARAISRIEAISQALRFYSDQIDSRCENGYYEDRDLRRDDEAAGAAFYDVAQSIDAALAGAADGQVMVLAPSYASQYESDEE